VVSAFHGGERCPQDFGTFYRWPDDTVLVACGCGWSLDGLSKRRAKRALHRHRVMARGEAWVPRQREPVSG
jgi:hypothetical protein